MSSIVIHQKKIVEFIHNLYGADAIPLHRPVFAGNEKTYLEECIDSNFVSSIGEKVLEFERLVADYTGVQHAVAVVNGTAALQVALRIAGVKENTEVITQALSFVATSNSIVYAGGTPIFVDVDLDTLGMSPFALRTFLEEHAEMRGETAWNKHTNRKIVACLPMHTFGMPCYIEEILELCGEWGIHLVEDAAESLGSFVKNRHTGTFGCMGTLSFNGNKILTTGGGGMIISDDEELALRAKHLTTTAKVPHRYEFMHDEVGYNYRLPNLNAALGCAQIEQLSEFLDIKNKVSEKYAEFFERRGIKYVKVRAECQSNNWLNAIILESAEERDTFLRYSNENGVMARPIWRLINELPMYQSCQHDGLINSKWLEERVINLPSSVPDSYEAILP